MPSVPPLDGVEGAPTRLSVIGSRADIEAGWPDRDTERVEELRVADGRLALSIDQHPEAGYRLDAGAYGLHRLSRDGLEVGSAPADVEPWRRERFLVARVLPLAATLRGQEVLHAGCVGIGDGAVAFLGNSHAGKTSLTVQMFLRGASFMTDDLMALEVRDGVPIAHPGAAMAGIRYAEFGLLRPGARTRLGSLADRGDKVWACPEREQRSLPLRAVYLLARGPEHESMKLERLSPPDPRELLAASFFARLALTPERLVNQLAVCSAIASSVPVYRAAIPADVDSARLAEAIGAHFVPSHTRAA